MLASPDKAYGQTMSSVSTKQSLGRRLVLATLIFCAIFTIAAVGVRTWFAWSSNLNSMSAELELIDEVFEGTLSKAVWEMDRDAITSQLNSVGLASPLGHVQLRIVRPGRAVEVLEKRKSDFVDSTLVPSLKRDLVVHPYEGASEVVGELIIEGNEALLWRRLWKEVLSIVATQVVQSLALAGLIMAMFNQSVTKHVRRIALHLGQLSAETLGKELILDRPPTLEDELTLLKAGVNRLQEKLVAHLARQRADERAMQVSRERLASLVQERTAELEEVNRQLEELSRRDALTGLANRRQFEEMKMHEFELARAHGTPLAVLMCDVDFFKLYNDSYGHAQGDECLKLVSGVLKSIFRRKGDLAARYGGEEFAVLLPGVELNEALMTAEKMRSMLAAREVVHAASIVSQFVTLSIGVAVYDPQTMGHFDQLLKQADDALYRAKGQGRDRVSV
ncbi:GGDEF domain-containing protein [Pseudomonas sp. NPDC087358]|uniref:GGDEF domain-containing protein n=1 Tax=Pseudomonas sp. NPDC087358 TaxID=3364439 RepID=UPI00384C2A5E